MNTEVEPLNVDGRKFLEKIGISFNAAIMKDLRDNNFVRFFKIGKKFMYYSEDIDTVNQLVRSKKISIRTDKGYYLTINN